MKKISLLLTVFLVACSIFQEKEWQDLSTQENWQMPKDINVKFQNGIITLLPSKYSTKKSKKADHYHLISKKKYTNFTFEVEVKIPLPNKIATSKKPLSKYIYGNSGIYVRAVNKSPYLVSAYQCEVDPSPRGFSGGLYIEDGKRLWAVPEYTYKSKNNKYYLPIEKSAVDFKNKFGKLFKMNQWNKIKIICKDENIQFFFNDVKTVDFNDSFFPAGHIALQHHGEHDRTYQFRKVRIFESK